MRLALPTADKRRDSALPGISGVARLDRRVPRLLLRLNPGDIAVIDVDDLDRSAADALVAARVAAVVNVRPSISGRYPTIGPAVLLRNGIVLLDDVGSQLFTDLKEGTRIRLDSDSLYVGERPLATGVQQSTESVAASIAAARAGLSAQLQAFAANTQLHMQSERELLLEGVGIPKLTTSLNGRHVLLVARGYDFAADLKALKHYIREFNPVLVGVDAGADVLREAGYRPEIVVGSLDTMSELVLREAADVVLHTDPHGRAPGLSRVQDLMIEPAPFATLGSSEDAAMLLADAGGARLMVTVGMRATLEEFLDSSHGGIASTVLTRLKVGGKVIDAKAAAQLFQTRISAWTALLVVFAAIVAIAMILLASTSDASYSHLVNQDWHRLSTWMEGVFS
jgi:uncharacterized membrane-anchored protein